MMKLLVLIFALSLLCACDFQDAPDILTEVEASVESSHKHSAIDDDSDATQSTGSKELDENEFVFYPISRELENAINKEKTSEHTEQQRLVKIGEYLIYCAFDQDEGSKILYSDLDGTDRGVILSINKPIRYYKMINAYTLFFVISPYDINNKHYDYFYRINMLTGVIEYIGKCELSKEQDPYLYNSTVFIPQLEQIKVQDTSQTFFNIVRLSTQLQKDSIIGNVKLYYFYNDRLYFSKYQDQCIYSMDLDDQTVNPMYDIGDIRMLSISANYLAYIIGNNLSIMDIETNNVICTIIDIGEIYYSGRIIYDDYGFYISGIMPGDWGRLDYFSFDHKQRKTLVEGRIIDFRIINDWIYFLVDNQRVTSNYHSLGKIKRDISELTWLD